MNRLFLMKQLKLFAKWFELFLFLKTIITNHWNGHENSWEFSDIEQIVLLSLLFLMHQSNRFTVQNDWLTNGLKLND